MRSSTNDPATEQRVAFLLCCVALISACASQGIEVAGNESGTSSKSDYADHVVGVLEAASLEYEKARAAGDAPAMVRAALGRLDMSKALLSESVAKQLSAKTVEMIRQARVIAADNSEQQAKIEEILSRADLGPTQTLSGSSNLFGKLSSFGSMLESQYLKTYVLAPQDSRLIRLRVSSVNGAIIYVEAPERSGVTLQVIEENQAPICSDSSQHGMLICRWRPEKDGVANVIIQNASPVKVPVLMISNQSVMPGE